MEGGSVFHLTESLVCLLVGAILLMGCSPSEVKPVQVIPLYDEHDIIYGSFNEGEAIYIISAHDLYFSKEGWVAYKSAETNKNSQLYVYKRPDGLKDHVVRDFVATNSTMFYEKAKKR